MLTRLTSEPYIYIYSNFVTFLIRSHNLGVGLKGFPKYMIISSKNRVVPFLSLHHFFFLFLSL